MQRSVCRCSWDVGLWEAIGLLHAMRSVAHSCDCWRSRAGCVHVMITTHCSFVPGKPPNFDPMHGVLAWRFDLCVLHVTTDDVRVRRFAAVQTFSNVLEGLKLPKLQGLWKS